MSVSIQGLCHTCDASDVRLDATRVSAETPLVPNHVKRVLIIWINFIDIYTAIHRYSTIELIRSPWSARSPCSFASFERAHASLSVFALASDQFDASGQIGRGHAAHGLGDTVLGPVLAHALQEVPGLLALLLDQFGVLLGQFQSVFQTKLFGLDRTGNGDGHEGSEQSDQKLDCNSAEDSVSHQRKFKSNLKYLSLYLMSDVFQQIIFN